MDQNGSSSSVQDYARRRSWREQDDAPLMHGAGHNVATVGPVVPGSHAPGPLPVLPIASGALIGQNTTPQNRPLLNVHAPNSYAPNASAQHPLAQPAPAQLPNVPHASAQHGPAQLASQDAIRPNVLSGSSASGSSTAGPGLPPHINRPRPNYSIDKTILVNYLVFLSRPSAEGDEPEFHQLTVEAPISSRAYKGAPPVSFRGNDELARRDQKKFFKYLDSWNNEIFDQKQRPCIRCNSTTENFYPQFKALYKFHKIGGGIDPERDAEYRPMCRIIPVCDGECYEGLRETTCSEEMQNTFLDTFGQFHEFHYNNPERDFMMFEHPGKGVWKSKPVLTWCGVCRERWYAKSKPLEPLSTQFHKHCTKPDKCQKFSRERAQERAGGASAVSQNLDTRHSSADQRDNGIDSPSGSTRQENNPQTMQFPSGHQPTEDPSARPASNGSGSTPPRHSKSLGGIHPWGEIKRVQSPSEQERESPRGSKVFMGTMKLKSTLGRKAGRSADNQNNSNEDRSEELSGNTP